MGRCRNPQNLVNLDYLHRKTTKTWH